MMTDLEDFLGSGLHVLDTHGKVNVRARLLVVGGSWSLSRLGEEDEVQSRAFGLVSWGWVLNLVSDRVLLYIIETHIRLTSRLASVASLLREKGLGARCMLAALCVDIVEERRSSLKVC
jgi:hypothetical protein